MGYQFRWQSTNHNATHLEFLRALDRRIVQTGSSGNQDRPMARGINRLGLQWLVGAFSRALEDTQALTACSPHTLDHSSRRLDDHAIVLQHVAHRAVDVGAQVEWGFFGLDQHSSTPAGSHHALYG